MEIIIDNKITKNIKNTIDNNNPHNMNNDVTLYEPSDIAESLKQLNDDTVEKDTGMSNIDMRSRLHAFEIDGLMVVDVLTSFGVLPGKCLQFSRQKKRLAVSLDGKGRAEIVDLFRGQNEQEISKRNPVQKLFGLSANNGGQK